MNNINSKNNPSIKNVLKLGKKNRERQDQNLFLIDGLREIKEALAGGYEVEEIFLCPEIIKEDLSIFPEKIKLNQVTPDIFSTICYKDTPDGYLAVVKIKRKPLTDIKLKPNNLIIILEKVEKPGNLGAILRTAYAVGAEAVIINNQQTDIYNPNVIRASEGKVFQIPVINSSREATVEFLKKNQIKVVAAATVGAKIYTEVDYKGSVALLLGSEATGLTEDWLAKADEVVKIPMKSGIDSLNVSISAAVILFEILRQRGGIN
jgi:TrmH family RNA methyltransferase